MKLRYDFGEKLDLSKFKKQAPHYIAQMRELNLEFYIADFRFSSEISTPDRQTAHLVSLSLEDIEKDEFGNLISSKTIYPLQDTRFKEISDIQVLFQNNTYKSHFQSHSVDDTVNRLCLIIKLLHKINNLKVFL